VLDAALRFLRSQRYRLVSVDAMLDALVNEPDALRHAVAFTVDDGYADFAEVARPVFRAHGCPVTVFVAPGPVERQCWYWWDQLTYAFARTRRQALDVIIDGLSLRAAWANRAERDAGEVTVAERLKSVDDAVMRRALGAVADALEVPLPPEPPDEFRVMTWDEIRACEGDGVTFGAHTMTHPILSRTTDAAARWELEESLRRVRAECRAPSSVFCYPNGTDADYSARERDLLRGLGVRAAVSTRRGYVRAGDAGPDRSEARGLYALPRWGFPEHVAGVVRIVSGAARRAEQP
jgi:peptidoglycan/xylan/chitin deacetylase (PgdA/CDA1 family)